ncbi:MAG: HK97 family phage prohead protease [Ahrensia sp.]|nr:HK97 family phage prohead protease [Ahrensia sp.]
MFDIRNAAGAPVMDKGQGIIEGYASTFHNVDTYGHIFRKGAYASSLARQAAEGITPVMLWSHRATEPAGKWTEIYEDRFGLYVRGKLNLETDTGRKAYAHLKEQDITGLSVGVRIIAEQPGPNGTTEITEAELVEISLVAVPANSAARVTTVKTAIILSDIAAFATRVERAAANLRKAI